MRKLENTSITSHNGATENDFDATNIPTTIENSRRENFAHPYQDHSTTFTRENNNLTQNTQNTQNISVTLNDFQNQKEKLNKYKRKLKKYFN